MSLVISKQLDVRALRDCLGCFTTGVAIITALDLHSRPAGLTVNSLASVSLDPPLILWSLRRDSRILPAFQASPGFIVNILAADQAGLSTHFSGRTEDKWAHVRYDRGLYGIPRLEGVHAALECRSIQNSMAVTMLFSSDVRLPLLSMRMQARWCSIVGVTVAWCRNHLSDSILLHTPRNLSVADEVYPTGAA